MNRLAMARAGSTGTNKPIKDRPIGGLGIHFIRNLTDSQHDERRVGRNILTLD
jgi:hypothetical protein